MTIFKHKGIPVNPYTFITVMNLFPLTGVILGELDYLSLIILYLIDTILIVFFKLGKMPGAAANYALDHKLYKQEFVTPHEDKKYRRSVYFDYFIAHLFIIVILTLIMMIPAAVANPRGEDFAVSSIKDLFYQRWFQWAIGLGILFHAGELFYYYKARGFDKISVKYLTRIDTRKFFLLFLLMFGGTLLAGVIVQLSGAFGGILIYSILLTAAKIYIDIRDYKLEMAED